MHIFVIVVWCSCCDHHKSSLVLGFLLFIKTQKTLNQENKALYVPSYCIVARINVTAMVLYGLSVGVLIRNLVAHFCDCSLV